MKTKEELNALKEEVETMNKKLAELTEDELKQVNGGGKIYSGCPYSGCGFYDKCNLPQKNSSDRNCIICRCQTNKPMIIMPSGNVPY